MSLWCLLPIAATAVSAAAAEGPSPTTVTIHLPREYPHDIVAPVAVRLETVDASPASWSLERVDRHTTPIDAQLDRDTGLLWFLFSAEKRDAGGGIKFRATPQSKPTGVRILPRPGGFVFSDDGRQVLYYRKDAKSHLGGHTRANYVHPLWGLAGEVLTEEFPSDHLHHHGVFWAWHQLKVGGQQIGDPWLTQDFLSVVRHVRIVDEGPVFATLQVNASWTSPLLKAADGSLTPIVDETTTLRVYHATGDVQAIDFEIRLTAVLPDVRIGGAENSRGYSGFTVRVAPPGEMVINDAQGRLAEDRIGGTSRWADVSGYFGPGSSTSRSGVAILSHPSLPEFPPRWLLRHYGMQNVVYPGREAIALSQDEPLVLRHRVLIHRGDADAARIPHQQEIYEVQW